MSFVYYVPAVLGDAAQTPVELSAGAGAVASLLRASVFARVLSGASQVAASRARAIGRVVSASAAGSGVIGRGAQALLSASAGAAATLGRLRSLAATLAAPSISQCPDRRTT